MAYHQVGALQSPHGALPRQKMLLCFFNMIGWTPQWTSLANIEPSFCLSGRLSRVHPSLISKILQNSLLHVEVLKYVCTYLVPIFLSFFLPLFVSSSTCTIHSSRYASLSLCQFVSSLFQHKPYIYM